jgi:hypothetical protein
MFRKPKDKKEKERLSYIRKYHEYLDKQWGLGYEELDEPIFVGHVRYYVLRDDVKRRKDSHHFKRILNAINFHQYTREKENPFKNTRVTMSLKSLNQKEYDKLFSGDDALPERFKYMFHKSMNVSKWGGRIDYMYTCGYQYYFEVVVEKHYLKKVRLTDPEYQSIIDKLSDKIQDEHLWEWYYGNYHRKDPWFDYMKYNRKMFKRGLEEEMREYHDEQRWSLAEDLDEWMKD